MNPGWVLICVGIGIMLGSYTAFENHIPDPIRAVVACFGGMIIFGLGFVVHGYVREEQAASDRGFPSFNRILPRKKREIDYKGIVRLIVTYSAFIAFLVIAVALSFMVNRSPAMDGRF